MSNRIPGYVTIGTMRKHDRFLRDRITKARLRGDMLDQERRDAIAVLKDLYHAGDDCRATPGARPCGFCTWCTARAAARKVLGLGMFPGEQPAGLHSWVGGTGVKFTGEGGVKRAEHQPFYQGEQGQR